MIDLLVSCSWDFVRWAGRPWWANPTQPHMVSSYHVRLWGDWRKLILNQLPMLVSIELKKFPKELTQWMKKKKKEHRCFSYSSWWGNKNIDQLNRKRHIYCDQRKISACDFFLTINVIQHSIIPLLKKVWLLESFLFFQHWYQSLFLCWIRTNG